MLSVRKTLLTTAIAAAAGLTSLPALALVTLDNVSGPVSFKFVGNTTENNVQAGTNETTWGVGSITSITQGINTLWNTGFGGDELAFMLYGIADKTVTPSACPPPLTGSCVQILNDGATGGVADGLIHLDIYRRATDPNITNGPAGRTSFSTYGTPASAGQDVTNGTLWLSLVFAPGIVGSDPSVTMQQFANLSTLPTNGFGSFFADITGGTAKNQFDTNGQLTNISTFADFFGTFTLTPNGNCTGGSTCFTGAINDPVVGLAVPEPTAVALLGLALLGAFGVRARKPSE